MKWFIFKIQVVALFSLFILSCGSNQTSFSLIPTGQTFKQDASFVNSKIDVLWVVDNSGSMSPSQTNMVNNFSSFMNTFISKGLDYQMAVTTTDAYKAGSFFQNDSSYSQFRDGATYNENQATYNRHTGVHLIYPGVTPDILGTFEINAFQGDQGSGDERAFSSFMASIQNTSNAQLVRPNSYLAIIILSDEDDFSSGTRAEYSFSAKGQNETQAQYNARFVADHNYSYSGLDSVESYISQLDTLTGSTPTLRHYNISAITVQDTTCQQALLAAHSSSSIIGQRYINLAAQTNGVVGSICDSNFANSLNNIQEKILELSTEFYLQRAPNIPTIAVIVNSVSIAQDSKNGWSYDSVHNGIMFHGTAIPSAGADITVNFDPMTIK